MASHIDGLRLRAVMGRERWAPPQAFGVDGWRMVAREGGSSVIVTAFTISDEPDAVEWVHASMTGPGRVPTYEDLALLHRAVWKGHGHAYQLFVPDSSHVNIHPHALHLWGRLDGRATMPDFGAILGSI